VITAMHTPPPWLVETIAWNPEATSLCLRAQPIPTRAHAGALAWGISVRCASCRERAQVDFHVSEISLAQAREPMRVLIDEATIASRRLAAYWVEKGCIVDAGGDLGRLLAIFPKPPLAEAVRWDGGAISEAWEHSAYPLAMARILRVAGRPHGLADSLAARWLLGEVARHEATAAIRRLAPPTLADLLAASTGAR
jgi:hypothetical protein